MICPTRIWIIRTGGEWRLSNFLIWQAAYAEYYTTPTFWPDFDEEELYKALTEFNRRERRFGRAERIVTPGGHGPTVRAGGGDAEFRRGVSAALS
ncbi:MAG: undecaprenyl diphosphate synthase family protein [Caldilineaceae bacterium]